EFARGIYQRRERTGAGCAEDAGHQGGDAGRERAELWRPIELRRDRGGRACLRIAGRIAWSESAAAWLCTEWRNAGGAVSARFCLGQERLRTLSGDHCEQAGRSVAAHHG